MGDPAVEPSLHPVGSPWRVPGAELPVLPPGGQRVVGLDRQPVVGRGRRPPHEPRVAGLAESGDHLARLLGDHVGGVATGEGVDLPVDVLDQVVVGVGAAAVVRVVVVPQVVRAGVPLVPARRHVVQRRPSGAQVLLAVAVEVLADQAGLVPRPLQDRGDRTSIRERSEAVGLEVGVDVVVVRVLPAQEARPGRAAQRVRRERVLEAQPPALQEASYVRHPPQVVPAHVVGLDDQHVGPLARHRAGIGCVRGRQRIARCVDLLVLRRDRQGHGATRHRRPDQRSEREPEYGVPNAIAKHRGSPRSGHHE